MHEGIRILGLGGSMRYNNGRYQCTEKDMAKRIRKLRFQLMRRRGFDILLTHAPMHGCGDQDDLPHRGFSSFQPLLDRYKPDCRYDRREGMQGTRGRCRKCAAENTWLKRLPGRTYSP